MTDRIRRQRRQELSSSLVRLIFKDISGFDASTSYRNTIVSSNVDDKSLTYGEVVAESFQQILLLIENSELRSSQRQIHRFVDLGTE